MARSRLVFSEDRFARLREATIRKVSYCAPKLGIHLSNFEALYALDAYPYLLYCIDVIVKREGSAAGLVLSRSGNEGRLKDLTSFRLPRRLSLKPVPPFSPLLERKIARVQLGWLPEKYCPSLWLMKPSKSVKTSFGGVLNFYGFGVSFAIQRLDREQHLKDLYEKITEVLAKKRPLDLQFLNPEGHGLLQVSFGGGEGEVKPDIRMFKNFRSEVKKFVKWCARSNDQPTTTEIGKIFSFHVKSAELRRELRLPFDALYTTREIVV